MVNSNCHGRLLSVSLIAWWTSAGKELTSWLSACAVLLLPSQLFVKSPRGRAVRAPGSRVRIPLEARFFPNLNGVSLHKAFHVHSSTSRND